MTYKNNSHFDYYPSPKDIKHMFLILLFEVFNSEVRPEFRDIRTTIPNKECYFELSFKNKKYCVYSKDGSYPVILSLRRENKDTLTWAKDFLNELIDYDLISDIKNELEFSNEELLIKSYISYYRKTHNSSSKVEQNIPIKKL